MAFAAQVAAEFVVDARAGPGDFGGLVDAADTVPAAVLGRRLGCGVPSRVDMADGAHGV